MNEQPICSPDDDRAAERRSANLKPGAGSWPRIAVVFGVGFVAKIMVLGCA